MEYLPQYIQSFAPEIIIASGLLVILLTDLFQKDSQRTVSVFAGLFLIAAFGLTVYNSFLPASASFGNKFFPLFASDNLSNFFKVMILGTGFVTVIMTVFSREFDEQKHRMGDYYVLLFGSVLGALLLSSATDLIVLYLSLEFLSLLSYILAGFHRNDKKSSEASLKYLLYGSAASGVMLFGISLLFGMSGTLNLYELSQFFADPSSSSLLSYLVLFFIIFGIGYKISAAPFHFWTPDVFEGSPTPVTAFFSIVGKAAGIAVFARILLTAFPGGENSLGYWMTEKSHFWSPVLLILSVLTMTIGNFSALWQNNIKRMLAFSSIAHIGYMLAGFAVMSDQGFTSVAAYFVVYLFMNLGAFLCAILLKNITGSENIKDYKGMGYRAPFIGIVFTIFLISLTGLPPTGGFVVKFYIVIAMVEANLLTLAIIFLFNSVVSLYYYVRILKHLFLRDADEQTSEYKPTPAEMLVMLLLVIPVLVSGLYFAPLTEYAKSALLFFRM